MASNINYYESEEPIYRCRWCEQEVEEEPLCAKEDTYEEKHYAEYEDGGADYRGSTFYTRLTGVCPKCFDEAVTLENILAFSKKNEQDAWDSDERFKYSVVSYLYSMDELLELAKKDMKARLESGIGIDEERVKKAMREYAHEDEDAFVEFLDEENRQ